MNEIPHPGFDKPEDYETFTTTNDLEEAAKDYSCSYKPLFPPSEKRGRLLGFTAGAKWQENKDQETIKLAEDHAFLAGADWQREKMMKESVEWTVTTNLANRPVIYLDQLKGFQYGDKVRVIVLPKED